MLNHVRNSYKSIKKDKYSQNEQIILKQECLGHGYHSYFFFCCGLIFPLIFQYCLFVTIVQKRTVNIEFLSQDKISRNKKEKKIIRSNTVKVM